MKVSELDKCPLCFSRHKKYPLACVDIAKKKHISIDIYITNLMDNIKEKVEVGA